MVGGMSFEAAPGPDERNRRPIYSVRFTAQELWGSGAPEKDSVNFSIGHDYLKPG